MSRLIAISLFALLSAQVRIEARLEEPSKKTTLQIEAELTSQYLRWLYSGTWGGREVPLMDILTRPEGAYLLDHQKKVSYLLSLEPPQLRAVSNPESLKKESALGYPATKYRLRLSDGSELTFAWTKAVSFDWRPWQQRLRDPLLSAILGAGFTEGLPLSWEHRSAQGELLSRWHIERVDTLQPDPLAGILPYDAIPIEKAVESQIQQK